MRCGLLACKNLESLQVLPFRERLATATLMIRWSCCRVSQCIPQGASYTCILDNNVQKETRRITSSVSFNIRRRLHAVPHLRWSYYGVHSFYVTTGSVIACIGGAPYNKLERLQAAVTCIWLAMIFVAGELSMWPPGRRLLFSGNFIESASVVTVSTVAFYNKPEAIH